MHVFPNNILCDRCMDVTAVGLWEEHPIASRYGDVLGVMGVKERDERRNSAGT